MLNDTHDFLGLLFGSFFRWWWAVLTGIASIFSFVFTPENITLSRLQFTIFILIGSVLIFFTASTVYQGYMIFKNYGQHPVVIDFLKSDSYGGEFIFIINGVNNSAHGKIVELRRISNGVEVPFAIVEIMGINSKGLHQANPIWISSGHLRDLRTGKFSISEIIVGLFVDTRTIQTFKSDS
jgi:hypothetical protein